MFVILGCVLLFKTFVHILFRSETLANLAAPLPATLFSVQNDMPHVVFLNYQCDIPVIEFALLYFKQQGWGNLKSSLYYLC